MADQPTTGYARKAAGVVYDALNGLIWLPHGSGKVRQRLVEAMALQPTSTVLELGCGTGQVTVHLLGSCRSVTSVDRSEAMLARARRRAPAAEFVLADALAFETGRRYDAVVLAFFLHELPADLRCVLLAVADRCLTEDGQLAILEWTLPNAPARRRAWRWFVRTLEPSPALEVLDGALDAELTQSGWRIDRRVPVAGGRAEALIVTRDRVASHSADPLRDRRGSQA